MKIFDWVQRKMNTNVMDYRKVPRNDKKDPCVADGPALEDHCENKKVETEKAALLMDLRHVASIQLALDEILTIGTLGHLEYQYRKGLQLGNVGLHSDQEELLPPCPLACKEEGSAAAAAEGKQEGKGEESSEEAPAASTPHHHHSVVNESFKKDVMVISATNINNGREEGELLLEPLLQETKDNKKMRITLADLFMESEECNADMVETSVGVPKAIPSSAGLAGDKEAKIASRTKAKTTAPSACRAKGGGSSLTKKLTSWKKKKEEVEDSVPSSKKLQRVIRRMLKKKIHPEMARDVNASVPSMRRTGAE